MSKTKAPKRYSCDFDHETNMQVRRLPTGGDSAMWVCHVHYLHEMQYRAENYPLEPRPEWESLLIYGEDDES